MIMLEISYLDINYKVYLDYLRFLDIYDHIYKVIVLHISVIRTQ